jgi:Copper chaperone
MKFAHFAFVVLAAILLAGPVRAAEKTVTLNVDNMICPSCAPVVKKSLTRVEGVTKVEVSVSGETNTATITFDETQTNVAALIEATTNAGYPSRLAK